MPESAARINPLRPRVCTIRLCLGEPPIRGCARARARARSVYARTRARVHIRRTRPHTAESLVALTRTTPGRVVDGAYAVMGAL